MRGWWGGVRGAEKGVRVEASRESREMRERE
jgi:hypothetical protein